MSTGKENAGVEETECWWGGDSWVMWLPSKSRSKKFQTRLCDIECCRRRGRYSSLDLERISSFIDLPSSNRINFGLSLFFTAKVIDWSKNYFWSYFLWEILSTFHRVRSLCVGTHFFHFEKISAQATTGECSPVLFIRMLLFSLYDKSEENSISHIIKVCPVV